MSSELQTGEVQASCSGNGQNQGIELNANNSSAYGNIPKGSVQIPQGWRSMTLGDVTIWSSGGTPKKDVPEYWDGDIPWISANSMYGTRFGVSDLKITEAGLKNGSRLAEKDSVLLLVRGGALHNRIPVGIATRDVAFNQDVKALKARTDLISPWYLLFWLMAQEKFLLESVVEFTGIGAGKLDTKRMQALPFLLPPAEEVSAIETLAKAIDDRIALLRETNVTLEAMAQALFKSWFVDFDPVHANAGTQTATLPPELQTLFPATFTETPQGLVPEGWEMGTLQDLLVLQRGFDLPASDRTEGLYPIIAASGPSGSHEKAMVKGPGVITGRSGVLGKVFFTLEDYWPLNTTLWIKEFKRATPCYALEVLNRLDMLSFNAGSAVPSLNRNHIHGLPYLLPPLELVNHFESVAMPIQQKMHANNQQAQTLATLRDTLLPRLISGQLRLPEAESALAEVV
nr:restriction endonuclease subunit S [uncultured Deefgea sp.]